MPTAVDLLHAIATTPDLPGAACVGHLEIFDACSSRAAGRPGTYARAVRICATCPALTACRAWVLSLPSRERPPGVTAGLVKPWR
jgi:hypothetical protein